MSLENKRILITRTRQQASELAAQLTARGAVPLLISTIEIVPPQSYAPLDDALGHLESYHWLLFTSANAVEVFSRRLASLPHGSSMASQGDPHPGDLSSSKEPQQIITGTTETKSRPKIAVIGPATARAVESAGFIVDLMPEQFLAESMAEALIPHAPHSRMLLIRAAEARDLLPETLTRAGASIAVVEAYRNQIPPSSLPALKQLFSDPQSYPDAITFTSASTARNLFALLEAASLALPAGITLASIGPITTRTLREHGYSPVVEALSPTISSLVEVLLLHFESA